MRPITCLASAAEVFWAWSDGSKTASGAIEVKQLETLLEMRDRSRYIEQRTMILSGVTTFERLTRLLLSSLTDSHDKEPLERDLEEMRLMLDELTLLKHKIAKIVLALTVSSLLDSLKADYQRSNAKLQVTNNITTDPI